MKARAMKNCPKDKRILLKIGDQWIEGEWMILDVDTGRGKYEPAWLKSHGCGCCGGYDPEPTAWAPLPKET